MDKYTWVAEGSSYVLSDVLAAILDAQLDKLARIQVLRAEIVRRYREGLGDWAAERGVRLAPELPERGPNHHIFYLLYPEARLRDAALRALREQGIVATFHYVPLHSAPHARKLGLDVELPVTDRVAATLLRLPLHPRLAPDEVDRVIAAVRETGSHRERGRPAPEPRARLLQRGRAPRASFVEIRGTLERAGRPFEVIFVDDVSRDGTRAILQEIVAAHPRLDLRVILHDTNRGRGATVTDGFRAARGEIAGYLDVDLEVHCRYIPSLVQAIEAGADVATVRRIYALQLFSLDRYFMSRGYSFLVRHLLDVHVRDTETGFKFFRRETVLPLLDEIEDAGWFWDTEFMVRAARRGLRVVEVPGAYIRREDKTSTVRGVRDSLLYFFTLLRFRRRLRSEGP